MLIVYTVALTLGTLGRTGPVVWHLPYNANLKLRPLALLTLWLGHRRLHIPVSTMSGILAGQHTQPTALAFASEQTGNDLPTLGYAGTSRCSRWRRWSRSCWRRRCWPFSGDTLTPP